MEASSDPDDASAWITARFNTRFDAEQVTEFPPLWSHFLVGIISYEIYLACYSFCGMCHKETRSQLLLG